MTTDIHIPVHPMTLRDRPSIQTAPTVRLAFALATCLEFGRPSLRIIGDGRAGKSTAAWYLTNTFSWRPFPVAFMKMVVGRPNVASEANFFREIALGMGMKVPNVTSTQNLIFRIMRAIEQEAARANAQVVVLTVDTADQLTLKDYEHLAKLQNHFLGNPVQPFFLFIHQRDADMDGSEHLGRLAPPHLYGRFFVDSHEFTGLLWSVPEYAGDQDACDVALALREFDENMRWPDESGPSYTEHFAPYAYSTGWRLESQYEAIKARVDNLNAVHGFRPSVDWLMASFNGFVYHLLTKIASGRQDFTGLTDAHIDEALRCSAYSGFESARHRANR